MVSRFASIWFRLGLVFFFQFSEVACLMNSGTVHGLIAASMKIKLQI